jgi:hypothetical protein
MVGDNKKWGPKKSPRPGDPRLSTRQCRPKGSPDPSTPTAPEQNTLYLRQILRMYKAHTHATSGTHTHKHARTLHTMQDTQYGPLGRLKRVKKLALVGVATPGNHGLDLIDGAALRTQ